ncbi:MAG: hypothetical protein KKB25_02720, partial [Nanoarchaeota archaeon]|nr:hypothetical protein [Nanoarchaeota archaeon]
VGLRKALEDKKLEKITDRDIYSSKEYVRRFVGEVQKVMQSGGGNYAAINNKTELKGAAAEGEMTEAKRHFETAEAVGQEEKIKQETIRKGEPHENKVFGVAGNRRFPCTLGAEPPETMEMKGENKFEQAEIKQIESEAAQPKREKKIAKSEKAEKKRK